MVDFANLKRGYPIKDNRYVCPNCSAPIFCIEESDGTVKDVCTNHSHAETYGVFGDRMCTFVRILRDAQSSSAVDALSEQLKDLQ